MSEKAYRLSSHAREEAERRGLSLDVIDSVIQSPNQIVSVYAGRKAYQSKVDFDGKLYLVRVIVAESDPLTVITVYRTSKIEKYWSDEA